MLLFPSTPDGSRPWRRSSIKPPHTLPSARSNLPPSSKPASTPTCCHWRVQVQISCSYALRGAARLTGAEPMPLDDKAASFDDLKALIAKTLEFLKSVDPKKVDGAEDRDITFPVGDRKQTMNGGDYLVHYSMPNFYFHVTTAYDILRNNGLEIGKSDFMGDA